MEAMHQGLPAAKAWGTYYFHLLCAPFLSLTNLALRRECSTMIRQRREQRYSRDQEALSTNLSSCTSEPSVEKLQLSALERVRKELQLRIQEHQERIHALRERLANQDDMDEQSRDFFLRQRLLEEHRLAGTIKEEASVVEQLGRLKQELHHPSARLPDDEGSGLGRDRRLDENFTLFLQNSPTKVSLRTSLRPHSADSPQGRRTRQLLESSSRVTRARRRASHLRTWSLNEESQLDKYRSEEQPLPGIYSPASEPSPERSFLFFDGPVAPVDEFRNSFSSRVIAPPRFSSKRASSLRLLHTSTKDRRLLFGNDSNKDSANEPDYGNVTIIPAEEPRPKNDLLSDFSGISLPDYAQSLMSEFEQSSQPSLTLSITQQAPKTPLVRKSIPLSPIIEQPSPQPSMKGKPSPKVVGKKVPRRQRSIFALRLPLRSSELEHASTPVLPVSSSSTSFFESTDDHYPAMRIPESGSPVRRKGLPSTRNHDLAMLGSSPNDLSSPPTLARYATPSSSRSISSRPLAVFRGVKNKLFQLGRR